MSSFTATAHFQLSVRARIIALALIPVIGFLANGIAFTSGENEVERRLRQRRHAPPRSPTPAASSRARCDHADRRAGFRRAGQRRPAQGFRGHAQLSRRTASTRSRRSATAERQQHRRSCAQQLGDLKAKFRRPHRGAETLGFTDSHGIRQRLDEAAAAVERLIITTDMSWLPRGRRAEAADVAADHAALRGRVPAQPRPADVQERSSTNSRSSTRPSTPSSPPTIMKDAAARSR